MIKFIYKIPPKIYNIFSFTNRFLIHVLNYFNEKWFDNAR
jgi:hypothetical protein